MRNKKSFNTSGVISALPNHKCFCGGEAFIQDTAGIDGHRVVSVFCSQCNNRTRFFTGRTPREMREEAIHAWDVFNRSASKYSKERK